MSNYSSLDLLGYGNSTPNFSMTNKAMTPPISMPNAMDGNAASVPMNGWDSMKQWFSDTPMLDSVGANGQAQQGMLGGVLGGAMGLGSLWLGMKQYGLAKDTLKHNKEMFYKNFDAQKRTTNASLEDRQKARVASNAGAYESVGSYMDKNGIK